jgi:hypothetical protein
MRWRKTRSTVAAAGISLTMITLVALGTSCSSSAQTSANVQAAPQPLMMQMAHGAIERGEKASREVSKTTRKSRRTIGSHSAGATTSPTAQCGRERMAMTTCAFDSFRQPRRRS